MLVTDAAWKENSMKDMVLIFLAICALWDMKTKKLPAMWLYCGLLWMGIYAVSRLVMDKRDGMEILLSLLPGMGCLIFARWTNQIGEGDAWLILGLGMCFSFYDVIGLVMAAFFLAAIGSILMMISKHNMKNQRIAFVPYLFFATLLMRIGVGI